MHNVQVRELLIIRKERRDTNSGDVGNYLFLFFSSSACLPSCRMVVISPCMKAQGTLDPARGQRSPLGQKTSVLVPCFLMDSAEHGKQNLWLLTVGHCTKCVSSNLWAQRLHFSKGLLGRPSVTSCASSLLDCCPRGLPSPISEEDVT